MKTSELQGAALDWAVAKCEGHLDRGGPLEPPRVLLNRYKKLEDTHDLVDEGASFSEWSPSTDWSQGGPIIEREDICLTSWYERWDACASHGRTAARRISGPTPLIAAMRCYCASKLGDDVTIPEELK